MLLTEEEIIGKCIPEARLFEILKAKDVLITKVSSGRNSVGDFLFIRAKWESNPEFYMRCTGCGKFHVGPYPGLSFFGMGFDEKDRRFFETKWRFHGATTYVIDTGEAVPLKVVLQEIEKRRPLCQSQLLPA
jgi:hypothetical protein